MRDCWMKKRNKRTAGKIGITIVCGGLLLTLYGVIFTFSAQDGEESGGLSAYVSQLCVKFLNTLTGKHWSEVFMQGMAEYFEHPIRKLAHFAEYAVMGVLVYLPWRQWLKRDKKLYLLTIVWVFLSAAADELHQFFVPGRYSSFLDVLLDTSGGLFGMLCLIWLEKAASRKAQQDMENRNVESMM